MNRFDLNSCASWKSNQNVKTVTLESIFAGKTCKYILF